MPCDAAGPNLGVWYTFTTGPGQKAVTLNAENLNPWADPLEIAVLDPTDSVIYCTAFTCLKNEELDCLVPNTSYTIFVWIDDGTYHEGFGICLKDKPVTAANDIKSGAIAIDILRPGNCSLDSSTVADLTKATPDPEVCKGDSPWGLWYTFNTGMSDTIVTVKTTLYQFSVTIYDEFDNEIFCGFTNDEATGLQPNTDYYLLVHRYNQVVMNFCLESFPAPVNDICANAETLTIQSAGDCSMSNNQIQGSTKGADDSGVTTSCLLNNWDGIPANHDVWYKFTTNGSQTSVQINTYNFNNVVLNHILSIFDDCNGSNEIFCTTTPNQSHIVSGLSSNTTYFLMLSGDDENTSNFKICLEEPPSPPANDQCNSALAVNVLTVGANCFAPVSADILGASTSNELPQPGCNRLPERNGVSSTLNGDLWYQLQIPASGELLIELGNVGWSDFNAAVYTGNCGNLVLEDCVTRSFGQDSLYLSCLSGGQVGYLRVWTKSKSGTTEFCLKQVASPIPDNNTCACAIQIMKSTSNCENSLSGTTINATRTFSAEFSLESEPEVWYTYTSAAATPEQVMVEISNFSGPQNPQFASLAIYDGSDCQVIQDRISYSTNTVSFRAEPGVPYSIALSTWKLDTFNYPTSAMGSFDICLSTCTPPSNSLFSSATPLTVDNCINGTTKCTSGRDPAVYYSFTPDFSGSYTIESANTRDGGLSFICVSTDSTNIIDCGKSPFTFCFDKGQNYYFEVSTYDTNRIDILEDLIICVQENGINEVCSEAIPLHYDLEYYGDFACPSSSGLDLLDCAFSGGEIWFSTTVPPSGELDIITDNDGNGPPLSMQVFEGTCDNLIFLDCDDADEINFDFEADLNLSDLSPGQTIYIALGLDVNAPFKYDFYPDQGPYRIWVEDPNPDYCPDDLTLSGTILGNANNVAADTISSNQVVESTADVTYDAGNTTLLNPGFDVKLGALFRVYTDGCTPSIPLISIENNHNIKGSQKTKQIRKDKRIRTGKKY